jgi:hypothetical protein
MSLVRTFRPPNGGRFVEGSRSLAASLVLRQNNTAERLRKGLRLLLKLKIDAEHRSDSADGAEASRS